jgi:G3E family GTPase
MFGRRLRHVRGSRIAVSIVRGAGRHDDGATVIVDDFGSDEVAPGPCACCTVRDQLQAALRARLAERPRKPFTRVVIETQAELAPILRTFASERALAAEFFVEEAPPLPGDRFVMTDDTPLSWNAFSRVMTTLQTLRGADLMHAKGLLNVEGCRGPVAVEFLQHLAHRPVELQAWPDETRTSRMAFVTRGLDERAIRSLFDAVRAIV